jgi:Putative lactococcus lactis phage r1t holin
LFTVQFWKDAAERAFATFFQTLVALVGVDAITDWNVINWWHVIVTSLIAAGLSIAKSVAVYNVNDPGTASVVAYEYPHEVEGNPDDEPFDDEVEEVEYEQDETIEPEEIPEQDLTPVEDEE